MPRQTLSEARTALRNSLAAWTETGAASSAGERLYPAVIPPGSEPFWPLTGLPEGAGRFNRDFPRFMAFQDDPGESFTALDFDFERDPPRLEHMAASCNPDDPDLGAFAAAGGRMITWHGLADAVVPHGKTVAYFEALAERHGPDLASFDRLFLIPGMDHRGIQPGPGIDQSGFDPLTALETWLETGTAPETLLATRTGADGQAEWSPPVCAWPQVARYDGTCDRQEPESFACATP